MKYLDQQFPLSNNQTLSLEKFLSQSRNNLALSLGVFESHQVKHEWFWIIWLARQNQSKSSAKKFIINVDDNQWFSTTGKLEVLLPDTTPLIITAYDQHLLTWGHNELFFFLRNTTKSSGQKAWHGQIRSSPVMLSPTYADFAQSASLWYIFDNYSSTRMSIRCGLINELSVFIWSSIKFLKSIEGNV